MKDIISALDELFSDGGVHPVVYRMDSESGPIAVEPTLQKCKKCVEALFKVSEAYFAYKKSERQNQEVRG